MIIELRLQLVKTNDTFRSSHDSIIKENINKIMQITAFKVILARIINIKGAKIIKILSHEWSLIAR